MLGLKPGPVPQSKAKMTTMSQVSFFRSTIGQTLDSNRMAITSIMWRASRQGDDLAKAAVGAERLPPWIMRGVKDASTRMLYSAARLGAATHSANNHPITLTLQDASTKHQMPRDFTADKIRATN